MFVRIKRPGKDQVMNMDKIAHFYRANRSIVFASGDGLSNIVEYDSEEKAIEGYRDLCDAISKGRTYYKLAYTD